MADVITLSLEAVGAAVAVSPDGMRHLILTDPQSGIRVVAPFTDEAAREVAAGLTGIHIATPGNGQPVQ